MCLFCVIIISCNDRNNSKSGFVTIDYNEHVRPIINNKCIACHGGVRQLAGVSFLFEDEALGISVNGNRIIVPGNAARSELIARVKHHDSNERMPMEEDPLSSEEIDILTKWINQGAKWKDHWAFIAPEPIDLPVVDNKAWIKNPIDQFTLMRMLEKGLTPSKKADKLTLLRRLSLDLIGLPPNDNDRDLFLNDKSSEAYEKLVDRLLASPRFGEHWTAMWLDLARYADSKGYEADRHREIWKYRDWLIDAFNQDIPFDQFTIDQIAGDLLVNPTKDQIIATAFHRNTMTNDEGGTDDEEFRVAAVIDRVNTTWSVWQGMTFDCVQCHSHPYDPFTHEEYYQFFSFFNNTADADLPTEEPVIDVYTKDQESRISLIKAWIRENTKNPAMAEKLSSKQIQLDTIKASTIPIMQALKDDGFRETHIFVKGNWLDKGGKVVSGVPASMPPLIAQNDPDRLAIAKWLISPDNPLTARVTVNRFWAKLFGRGIVDPLEDFGSQGSKPTHPKLLDWLALYFQEDLEWGMKSLLKTMVTSSTYMQSSIVTPEKLLKDPDNFWLARSPRIRLTAEQVRDQSLAVSNLLSEKMYGPSVKPYQPDGVWQVIYNEMNWELSEGEDAYRRGLYTYWRRTSPYPSMMSFDSPSRDVCINSRINTNTPIQALVTLNDPVYLEAANSLAGSINKNEQNIKQKIRDVFQRALIRVPTEAEVNLLENLHREAFSVMEQNSGNFQENYYNAELKTPMSIVANAILNLDEFLTRE